MRPSTATEVRTAARPVRPADRGQISDLIYSAPHLHRHLDWRPPLDWIGEGPFWALEDAGRIVGALACPREPQSIAWIRLFTFGPTLSGRDTWQRLWGRARRELAASGGATAAAIATQAWMEPLLADDGFRRLDDIVVLSREVNRPDPATLPRGVTVVPMRTDDLHAVADTDAAAFEPLWHNSLEALSRAYLQASYVSVARDRSRVLGYQLSTASALGTHLARLAVRPEAQNRGLGAALVSDLICHIGAAAPSRLTVNTQGRNAVSLNLYAKLGFRLTGEKYPVYTLNIPAVDSEPGWTA